MAADQRCRSLLGIVLTRIARRSSAPARQLELRGPAPEPGREGAHVIVRNWPRPGETSAENAGGGRSRSRLDQRAREPPRFIVPSQPLRRLRARAPPRNRRSRLCHCPRADRRAGVAARRSRRVWGPRHLGRHLRRARLQEPEPTAAKIAARGVKTVYVETANDRSTVDVVNPKALGFFVDALEVRGIRVVAWYLPGFVKPARRRSAR